MATRLSRTASAMSMTVFCAASAQAQFPSPEVSWEGQPVNVTAAKEVFQRPETSGSTQGIVTGTEAVNDAFRSTGQGGFDGSQAYQVFFSWVNPADPTAWVRLTTFNTAQLPNPALDTRGKVRFRIKNVSELFNGEVGLCIGVRETGVDVPQLSNGGTVGAIEWVGVDQDLNAIIEPVDGNGLCDTQATGDDVQVVPLGNLANAGDVLISPGLNGMIDTTPNGDDAGRFGYIVDGDGDRIPLPAVTIPVVNNWVPVEWDLMTGDVTVDGVTTPAALVGFTGNGTLADAPNFKGTLEHLAITPVTTDPAVMIAVFLDVLQFEATVADVTPAPVIQTPVTVGATSVTVNGVIPAATLVTLKVDNGVDPDQTIVPLNQATSVTFTLPHPAIVNQVYTATQTSPFGESALSAPATVVQFVSSPFVRGVPKEGDTSVTVLLVDAAATQVDLYKNDAFVASLTPAGLTSVFFDNLDPLVAGDSLHAVTHTALSVSAPSPPAVTSIATTTVLFDDNYESYADQAAFQAAWPPTGTSLTLSQAQNNTPGGLQSAFSPNTPAGITTRNTRVTSELAPDANEPITWQVDIFDPAGNPALTRQYAELRDNVPASLNQLVAVGMNNTTTGAGEVWTGTRYQARLAFAFPAGSADVGWYNLNGTGAPLRSPGWHRFTIIIQDTPAVNDTFDVYIDGIFSRRLQMGNDPSFDLAVIGSGLSSNGGLSYYDNFRVVKGAVELPTPATPVPTLASPLEANYTSVTVNGLAPNATDVSVYADGLPLANVNPGGAPSFTLTVPVLVAAASITAKQTAAPGGQSNASEALRVGSGNGPVSVAVGVRETEAGGAAGPIEWIGASAAISGAPQGKPFAPGAAWQTFIFDPAVDPITGFTGNGIIDGVGGVLEHLAISVDSAALDASNGVFVIYIDNVENVGGTGLIQDFESTPVLMEVLFQEPSFSGTTSGNLGALPNDSAVTDAFANGGLHSARVSFFFKDIAPSRWLRLTTSVYSPMIDLTKPIKLDLLMLTPVVPVEIVSANPPSDNPYVAGTQPFRDVLQTGTGPTLTQGIGGAGTLAQNTIVYSPVGVAFSGTPSPAPAPGNVTVACTGGPCPTVTGVTGSGSGPYDLTFSGPIPPGHCTTVTFAGTTPGQKLQYQYLPCDLNMSGSSSASDVSALVIAINNGNAALPANLARYNINRVGVVSNTDVLRMIGLLNGVNTTQVWTGAAVAACP